MKKIARLALLFALFGIVIVSPVSAHREIITLQTRYDINERAIMMSYLLDAPEKVPVRSIFLVVPGGNGAVKLVKGTNAEISHNQAQNLFFRLKAAFHDRSIALAMPDVPGDQSSGISYKFRRDRAHWEDLAQLLKDLRTRYPEARIYLAGTGSGALSALFAAKSLQSNLSGIILAGMDSNELSVHDHSGLKIPVLVLHHLEDGCNSSPVIEAMDISSRYSFLFVPFSGRGTSKDNDPCSSSSIHGLVGLEGKVAETVVGWMEKGTVSREAENASKIFLNEQVIWVPMKSVSGEVRLQTTIFKPDGSGPFPLAIINHGANFDDVRSGALRYRQRYSAQSRIFVDWGFAVAIPMRRGYGSSGGAAVISYSIDSFGLENAKEIEAVIEFMGKQPYIDTGRMLLVGQSAGGLTSLAYGSLGRPAIKGIINFAGGLRLNNVARWEQAMAGAFGKYAQTTKAPSIWFYAENDSYFSPGCVRTAYDEYSKNGGQATLYVLPAFKKDGHHLFSDPSGIPIWRQKVLKFLQDTGLRSASDR